MIEVGVLRSALSMMRADDRFQARRRRGDLLSASTVNGRYILSSVYFVLYALAGAHGVHEPCPVLSCRRQGCWLIDKQLRGEKAARARGIFRRDIADVTVDDLIYVLPTNLYSTDPLTVNIDGPAQRQPVNVSLPEVLRQTVHLSANLLHQPHHVRKRGKAQSRLERICDLEQPTLQQGHCIYSRRESCLRNPRQATSCVSGSQVVEGGDDAHWSLSVDTLDEQIDRAYLQYQDKENDLHKNSFLQSMKGEWHDLSRILSL